VCAAALVLILDGDVMGQAAPTASSAAERRAVEGADRLRQAGLGDQARASLQEYLARQPASPAALASLFELSDDDGDVDAFLPWIERAVASGAPDGSDASGAAIHSLWVESLIRIGRPDSAFAVARRWVRAQPEVADAHLGLSGAQIAQSDSAAARETLEQGLGAASEDRPILERLADLYAAAEDRDRLAESWLDLLAEGELGLVAVVEDARSGHEIARAASRRLWGLLAQSPDREVTSAGAYAALRLGARDQAGRLARGLEYTEVADRARFLRGYAAEATEAGLPSQVAWAAEELAGLSTRVTDRQRWQAVAADMALAGGDTSSAQRVFEEILDQSAPGEAAHRLASRKLFAVLAGDPGELARAATMWESHRRTYPDSVRELAEMAAELGYGRAHAGELQAAEEGLRDARSALSTGAGLATVDGAGGRLALYAGQRDSAIVRLERAAAMGAGTLARTADLALLGLLERADVLEVEILGEALLSLHRSPDTWGAAAWLDRLGGLPASAARPAMFALLAAELKSAGQQAQASGLLLRIVDEFPASPETPAALLELARGAEGNEPDSARAWLERLITSYPESALAPLARRLLEELRGRGRPG
jgi:hypothetical protein